MGVPLVKSLLEDEWREDVPGRDVSVPKPEIVLQAPENRRQVNLKKYDVIFVRDGGRPTVQPQSLSWREERIEETVTIDCYSRKDINRIEGHRDDDDNREKYGGLKGEVKRILDKYRKGHKEYDLIIPETWIDLHADEPGGIWRGQWEITMVRNAVTIGPRDDEVFD